MSEKAKYFFVFGLYVAFSATVFILPRFFETSWTMSAWSITWSSYAAGGERKKKRSCPLWAATSAAARAGMSAWLMWSTSTSVSFASPQRLT